MPAPLFQISEEMRLIGYRIECHDGDDLPNELVSELGCLRLAVEDKIADCAGLAREWDLQAATMEGEADRIATSAKRLRRKADNLRGYALHYMQAHHIGPIRTPAFTVRVATNPPAVSLANADTFVQWAMSYRPELVRVPPTPAPAPDKKAIAALLKEAPDALPDHLGVTVTRSHKLAVS